MKNRQIFIGMVVLLGLGVLGLLLGLATWQAQARQVTPTWQQVNADGFGDPLNQQIASLEVFNGYIYAGLWHYLTPETSSAQIWRSSTGADWQMVDERNYSGAADMVSYNNGIYAGSWDGNIWSSSDGISWTDVITDGFDDPNNGIAHFEVYNDVLYASTWNVDGTEIWRTTNGQDWDQFVDAGLHDPDNGGAIASEIFDGLLYWGVLNIPDGAEIWRSNGITTTAVITHGFGITDNQSVSSLAVFGDNLYAGMWNINGVQVWRSPDGLQWTQVLDGLGNPPDYEINGLEVYRGKLYLVVQCNETGMQVWRTSNGTDWEQVGFAGFGDANNQWSYWDNATTVFKDQLYVATINFASGGEVWRMEPETYFTLLPCTFRACTTTYLDNFSDPNSGWPQGEDSIARLGYVSGEYQILVKQAYWVVYAYADFMDPDFWVEVDARPVTHLSGAVGLIFSRTDDGYYLFEISENWFTLWRRDPGNWVLLIDWTQTPALLPGFQSNHLKVIRDGTSIALYANGQLLATYSDDTYHGTGIGMVSEGFEDNYDGRFDNLKVYPGCLELNGTLSIMNHEPAFRSNSDDSQKPAP